MQPNTITRRKYKGKFMLRILEKNSCRIRIPIGKHCFQSTGIWYGKNYIHTVQGTENKVKEKRGKNSNKKTHLSDCAAWLSNSATVLSFVAVT